MIFYFYLVLALHAFCHISYMLSDNWSKDESEKANWIALGALVVIIIVSVLMFREWVLLKRVADLSFPL